MFSTTIVSPDPAPEDAVGPSPIWCFQRKDLNASNTALEYPDISKQELAETNTWRALRRQLRFPWLEPNAPDDEYPGTFRQVASLKPPEAKILDRYVPQPGHWDEVDSPSLEQYIADACETASRPRTPHHTIFVRRPFSPVDRIVEPVLREYQFSILPPPSPEEILEGNSEWMRKWEKNDSPRLACVNLEKCFLNSHRGLSLIRQLLDWLWKTEKTCVLVCSSWAFNFLAKVVPLNAVISPPIFLQPFTEPMLNDWFEGLADAKGNTYAIREAEPPHLPVIVSPQIGPQPKAPPSDLLTQIADYTRGNPWLAWKIWRANITRKPLNQTKVEENSNGTPRDPTQLYVRSWKTIRRLLPRVNRDTGSPVSATILHSLLLHDGLSEKTLAQILPFQLREITTCINLLSMPIDVRLAAEADSSRDSIMTLGGLIDYDDASERWMVTELAYRNVTEHLKSRRFPIPAHAY